MDAIWYDNPINAGVIGLMMSKSCAEKAGDIAENVAEEIESSVVVQRTHGEKQLSAFLRRRGCTAKF
ncbi:MAG TPA: hypothetical protein VEI95_00290 [Acidobacteriota bacterium]|nr:hypothetical protein [Acidobacteriota bacterium]